MYKYWSKHKRNCTHPPPPSWAAHFLPTFSESFSTALSSFSFVGYQLCSKSVINIIISSQEEVYELDDCFFYKAWFCLGGYMNGWKSRILSAENKNALHGNPPAFIKDWCFACSVWKMKCGTLALWRDNYCGKLSKSFDSIHWSPRRGWTEMLVSARWGWLPIVRKNDCFLSGLAFGHHNPQTSCHLTSFYGDFLKKEFTAITQEAWRTLNITVNRLVLVMTNELFKKLQNTLWKA
jgi:hypothetical protein